MKFVALVSGGKDSTLALYATIKDGHELVALANLRPPNSDDTDSYMYQTVGQDAIQLYAEAIGVPLFQRVISGTPINLTMKYTAVKGDEVEDLYQLLLDVRKSVQFDAVVSGAIESKYQYMRVKSICSRLGAEMISPMWHEDPLILLTLMIHEQINAILVKVCSYGLEPGKHLGKSITEVFEDLKRFHKNYGMHLCGEGGEYETLTLDCHLFKKRIVM